MKRLPCCTALLLAAIITVNFLGTSAPAQANSPNMLAGLKKEHPRLFLTPKRLRMIHSQAKTDPILVKLIELTKQDAEKMLRESPVKYEIPDGKRLLGQSRYALRRIWTLSLAYRLTGENRFLDAAVNEMLTAAKFKDWNPSHFLDTAEMTTALAVGYDWLYDAMDPEDRKTIRKGIVELGLKSGLENFKEKHWWTRGHNNWNQVCNGGMLLGALAVADEEPELANRMIDLCLKSIPNGLAVYGPDGAYPEGPGYWIYGTTYTVLTMLGLDSALGHDFDIHKSESLDRTVLYRLYMEGPLHHFFNYADGGSKASPDFAILGLAYLYHHPSITRTYLNSIIDYFKLTSKTKQRPRKRFAALNVVYYPECKKLALQKNNHALPLDTLFQGQQDTVTMRSKWNDPNAIFLGIKAGDNQASHGHLDIGSFVLDANGVRWAMDFGSDNYNMPGYFRQPARWQYYRLTNLSHNTLVIGGKLQNTKGVAKVIDFQTTPEKASTTIDMTDAYQGQAESVLRKAAMLDRNRVVIRDMIIAPTDNVRWGIVTAAEITLDGPRAVMKQGEHQMNVEIVSPPNARFEIVSTKPKQAIEHQNQGYRMLAFTTKPNGKKPITLEVVFTPVK